MVEKLCKTYGRKILELDGQEYHSFPTLTALSDESVEKKLRELGFGYRAAYIQKTAKFIAEECPPNWLNSLRSVPYEQAHDSLTKLMGVGSKVSAIIINYPLMSIRYWCPNISIILDCYANGSKIGSMIRTHELFALQMGLFYTDC